MPETVEHAIFIPPEGVAQLTGEVTYDGRWYEFLGEEEVGSYEDPVTHEVIPGTVVQKKGRLVQAVDDGDPTSPVTYEVYEGPEEQYRPTTRTGAYQDNVQHFIAEGAFEGHPTEPEDLPDAPAEVSAEQPPTDIAEGE